MADGTGTHDAEHGVAGTNGLDVSPPAQPADSTSEDQAGAEIPRRSRWRRRVMIAGIVIVVVAAAIVVPPLINISHYKRQVTSLMSRSLGRPVRMSSVELRLLPRPGFVLNNLSVGEDPEFGAEPVLSAETVVASIRILSLWRGNLEIDKVSVDVASLNLVRTPQGRWNLDSLMINAQPALTGRGASATPEKAASGTSRHFPYLEATDSQVNFKDGVEKTPFSLIHTDLSLWQDAPGQWRVRLRGQPVRTDLDMSLADTGELRMEGSLRSAPTLREMPIRMQMEWREAQLGQLSRLLFGSDAGWRGAVTADIDVEGTPDAAQTKARLRATGVRREEFAPETPIDFDANCNFRYQHSQGAVHDLGCDTAIGNGHLHLKGELPGSGQAPQAMVEARDVPLQAGLDLLRTVRSGFAPGISVKGSLNGSLAYKQVAAEQQKPDAKKFKSAAPSPKSRNAVADSANADGLMADLTGSLTADGVQIKGGELKTPLSLPRITLTPALLPQPQPSGVAARSVTNSAAAQPAASEPRRELGLSLGLGTRFTIPLATAAPAQPPSSQAGSGRAGAQPASPAGAQSDRQQPNTQSSQQPNAQASAAPNSGSNSGSAQAMNVHLALGIGGYSTVVSGSATTAKVRELAYAFGLTHLDAADSFAGGTADLDLSASGPWIASDDAGLAAATASTPTPSAPATSSPAGAIHGGALKIPGVAKAPPGAVAEPLLSAVQGQGAVSGSLLLHHTQWKPAYLALPVDLSQATITIAAARITLSSDFSYGLKSVGNDSSVKVSSVKDSSAKDSDKAKPQDAGTPDAALAASQDAKTDAQASAQADKNTPVKPAASTDSGKVDSGTADSAKVSSIQANSVQAGPIHSGPVKGSVVVTALTDCKAADCVPDVQLRFGSLDAAEVEAALLGAPQQKSLLSPLIDRIRSSDRPKWPEVAVTVQADSLLLSPLALEKVTLRMRLKGGEIAVDDWEANLLEGSAKGTGHFAWTGDKPEYALDGSFTRINGSALGALLNTRFSGGLLHGTAKMRTTGLNQKELGDSASGELQFDWTKGVLPAASQEVRFDEWSGTVAIQGGKAQVGKNTMLAGRRSSLVAGAVPFGGQAKLSVTPSDTKLVAHAGRPTASAPTVK